MDDEARLLDLSPYLPQLAVLVGGWQAAVSPTVQKSMADSTLSLIETIRLCPATDHDVPDGAFGVIGDGSLSIEATGIEIQARWDEAHIYALDVSLDAGTEFACRFGAPAEDALHLGGSFLTGSASNRSFPEISILATQGGTIISNTDFSALGIPVDPDSENDLAVANQQLLADAFGAMELPEEPVYDVVSTDDDTDFAAIEELGTIQQPEVLIDTDDDISPPGCADVLSPDSPSATGLSPSTITSAGGIAGGIASMAIGTAISLGSQAIRNASRPTPPNAPPAPAPESAPAPAPERQWYYMCKQDRVGPVTQETIQQRIKERVLGPATLVWQEGMAEWVALEKSILADQVGAKCHACNSPVPDDAKFCTHCGAPLSIAMSCPTCSAPVTENQKFCRSCGAALLK